MILAVVAYPALDDSDRQWIESFRARHDPQSDRIAAHFTLVFPVDAEPGQVVPEIAAAARSARPIEFSIHGARVVEDPFGNGHHIFLAPDQGAVQISALHDRLYAGSLRVHLRADIPYIAHITAGLSSDSATALRLAEDINAVPRVIRGVIDRVELIDVGTRVVRPIEAFRFTAGAV